MQKRKVSCTFKRENCRHQDSLDNEERIYPRYTGPWTKVSSTIAVIPKVGWLKGWFKRAFG